MMWILVISFLFIGMYFISVLEHWSVYRSWDFAYPFAAFSAYFVQEDVIPRKKDTTFFETAPVLFIVAAVLAMAVLPFSEDAVLVKMGTGALFVNAALAYIGVSFVMAGWAPNGVYSMLAGWRFLGQLISYSMPILMVITATVMRAESMDMTDIVTSQADLWNILYQPVGFLLFFMASMALVFLPPFDIPQADGELAGGVFSEYTGKRLLVFRIGRLILIFTLSLATTNFYLGGWHGGVLPGAVWVLVKTLLVAMAYFLVGSLLPRIRHDHVLEWSWKYGVIIALFNILWVGIILLL